MIWSSSEYGGVALRRVELAGAACSELVDGVVQLRPEDAMVEAMLHGWRAQQGARGLRVDTSEPRERLVRRCPRPLNSHVFSSMLRKNAWGVAEEPVGSPEVLGPLWRAPPTATRLVRRTRQGL